MRAQGPEIGRLQLTPPCLVLASLLFAVAVFDGRPTVFADTPFYYSQGRALAHALGFPLPKMTSAQRQDPYSVEDGSEGAETGSLTVAAARSPIYGLFLYLLERTGGLWLLVAAQCLAAAWTIALAIRCVAAERARIAYLLAIPALTLASSLPFFAAFIMPDVFTGLDVLAAGLLLFYSRALSRGEGAGLFWLIAFSAASHTSNLLTLVALLPTVAFLRAVRVIPSPIRLKGSTTLVAACGAAVALTLAAGAVFTLNTGRVQGTPPFLMARVLEDGPGRAYLAKHCPNGAAPDLCPYKRLPLDSAEEILWSGKPGVGVFMRADPAARRRLKSEELRFVIHSVIEQPLQELIAAMSNWRQQLALYATIEPLHNPAEFLQFPQWRDTSIWRIFPGRTVCERQPSVCEPRISRTIVDLTQSLSIGLSLILLALTAVSSDLKTAMNAKGPLLRERYHKPLSFTALVLIAIFLNAGVCGIISGPFPRYQARLIWLVPLVSGLLVFILPWKQAIAAFLARTPANRDGRRPEAAPS